METITSRSNEKIKYASLLGVSASKRTESGEFLSEGARLCSDAARSGVTIISSFFTQEALSRYGSYISEITGKCRECFIVSDSVAQKLSATGNTQGVFCVCKTPVRNEIIPEKGEIYIALENVQDPSNVGAIIRSAEAIGINGIIVSGGCDLYNPKVLRSSMGSAFRLNISIVQDLPAFLKKASENGLLTLAAVPADDALDIRNIETGAGVVCCVGNEGNGLTEETVSACAQRVTIPMKGLAESLNVSAAASIIAWELNR